MKGNADMAMVPLCWRRTDESYSGTEGIVAFS